MQQEIHSRVQKLPCIVTERDLAARYGVISRMSSGNGIVAFHLHFEMVPEKFWEFNECSYAYKVTVSRPALADGAVHVSVSQVLSRPTLWAVDQSSSATGRYSVTRLRSLPLINRPWRDGRLSRSWCTVAAAEIRTNDRHRKSESLPHGPGLGESFIFLITLF